MANVFRGPRICVVCGRGGRRSHYSNQWLLALIAQALATGVTIHGSGSTIHSKCLDRFQAVSHNKGKRECLTSSPAS
jgi:hypothetical protein